MRRLIGSNVQKRRKPAAVATNGAGGGKGRGKGKKKVLEQARKRNGDLVSKATSPTSKCNEGKATTGTSAAASGGVDSEYMILSDSDDDGLQADPPSRTWSQTPLSNKRKLSRLQGEAVANYNQHSINDTRVLEEPLAQGAAGNLKGNIGQNKDHPDQIYMRDPSSWLPEKHILELVLDVLQRRDTYEIFAEPVNPSEVEHYYEIIKEPMDLGTMRAKLHEGMYRNLQEFEYDVFLIFQNAMYFNSSGTVYFRQARALDELAKNVFHVLKTDPWKFEQEFAFTKRRLTRKLCAENRGQGLSNLFSKVGKDFKTNSCITNLDASSSLKGYKGCRGGVVNITSTELNRRSTYKPWTHMLDETDTATMATRIGADPFICVNQQDLSYRESLLFFANDLGPTARRIAKQKLEQGLPTSPSIRIPRTANYQTDPTTTTNSQTCRASLQPSRTPFQHDRQPPSFGTSTVAAPMYSQSRAKDNPIDTKTKAREIPMMNFSDLNKSPEAPPQREHDKTTVVPGPTSIMDISRINNSPASQGKRRHVTRKQGEEEGFLEKGIVLAIPAVVPGMDYGFQRRRTSASNFSFHSNNVANLNSQMGNSASRAIRKSRNGVKIQESASGKSNSKDRAKPTLMAEDLDHQHQKAETSKVERNHLTKKLDLNQAFSSCSQLTNVPKPHLASALQDQFHDAQPAALRLGSGLKPQVTKDMGAMKDPNQLSGPDQFHSDMFYLKSRINGRMTSFKSIGNSSRIDLRQEAAAASMKQGYCSLGVKPSSPFPACREMMNSATEHKSASSSSSQPRNTGEHSKVVGTNLPNYMRYNQQELKLLQNLQGKFGIPRYPCRL